MRNVTKLLLAAATMTLVVVACSDRSVSGPTPPRMTAGGQGSIVMGTCTTVAQLNALATAVFGPGSPNVNSVLGKIDNMRKKVEAGDVSGAANQANNIVMFVRDKATAGALVGTQEQIAALISGVLCYAGLSPDTFLILPSDDPQVRKSSDGAAGVSLLGNTVTEPTLLTITTLDSNGPSPLITKLDQYPTFINITVSSEITKPAVVAVCPPANVPADVRARLRVGHQTAAGFEVTPNADASFLRCDGSLAQSRAPRWLQSLASLVLPKLLHAATFEVSGIGGSATEFSPFGAVDTELSLAGGVGGSSTEFIRSGPTSGPSSPRGPVGTRKTTKRASVVVNGVCTEVSATVGTALEAECRPVVTLTTHNGTVMNDVPVAWAVTAGGGTIAPDVIASQTCGAFANSAATATDASGKAGVCWTLGPNGGANTATATPSAGGDAPEGVTFSPATRTFTATGNKITPTATATGGIFVFDNAAHAGSGTCSDGLVPALTYSNGEAPSAAGSYTLTVTCGEGSTVYNTATATATISIGAVVPTVSVSCPASVVFTGSAQTPCSATATAPGLSLTPTPSYSNNTNVGTATATVTLAANGNYAAASGSQNFAITAAATNTVVTCSAASFAFTGSAITPCSASTTGAGGLNVARTVSYTNNVNVGTASASASYPAGGNYLGSNGSTNFGITAAGTTTTVTCPASLTYTGAALTPCTAAATGPGNLNVSVSVTYGNNVNVGTATASASYAGGGNYQSSNGGGSFAITKRTATATSGNATINFGAAVPSIPCAVTGLLAVDAGTVTCTSSVPAITAAGNYPVTPVVSPASPLNYAVANVNGTLAVAGYVQVGCFSSPIYSVMPPTKSAQRKGSNVPVKCTLTTPQGAAVTNATGNIVVQDRGTNGLAAPVTVFTGANAFKLSNGGNYAYGLDTSPAGYVVGHYYYVTATWSDGSTTTGWFLLK